MVILAGPSARRLAQEVLSWYLDQLEPYAEHKDNVQTYLRGPVIAVTVGILTAQVILTPNASSSSSSLLEDSVVEVVTEPGVPADTPSTTNTTKGELPAESQQQPSSTGATATPQLESWRVYLEQAQARPPGLGHVDEESYEQLNDRAKARLEAFLMGVVLAVRAEADDEEGAAAPPAVPPARSMRGHDNRNGSSSSDYNHSFSLVEGLAGFRHLEQGGRRSTSGSSLLRSIANQSSSVFKFPQIPEEELVMRLELYIRTLYRVKAQGQDCVITAEPARAVKARVRSLTHAYIETVSTVRQQGPVLTRLLYAFTQELLAVSFLAETLVKVIRRLVVEYEQVTSFASLAFLSSPEVAADQRLMPMVLQYVRYLQQDWKACVEECERERMLYLTLDPVMRRTFKTVEFQSIGHLLEVCRRFRDELMHIELSAGTCFGRNPVRVTDDEAIRQAIRDLQRESITINGQTLAPVKSRRDLIQLLSQTLNSGTLPSPVIRNYKKKKGRRLRGSPSQAGRGLVGSSATAPPEAMQTSSSDPSESEDASDGWDSSEHSTSYVVDTNKDAFAPTVAPHSNDAAPPLATPKLMRKRSFGVSTIDLLTKRLLLAGSRTGTGGDAYFVVRDLFGGEDVEVVPSHEAAGAVASTGATARRLHYPHTAGFGGGIEIVVTLGSVTIRCHGSFDIYPKSMVGDCEPLIQIHTTTSETITLQEVRTPASSSPAGTGKTPSHLVHHHRLDYDTDDSEVGGVAPVTTVLQEKVTERTGYRTLSIRPALYERVSVLSTPS